MTAIKQLPYGVSDFVDIRQSDLYYVDKTMYLPKLEAVARTAIFIRPRRFGKSSLLSMMKAYYDKNMSDQFDDMFSGLYIGSHPTENRNRYQVLYFDFSRVSGNIDTLAEEFDKYCSVAIDGFVLKYSADYGENVVAKVHATERATAKLNLINIYAAEKRIPLYLIIDEYDNFTNVVLNEHGEAVYRAITRASGFYRDMFKVFKGMFERIFLTGVSPVTLDDLTSGFNIGMNLSLDGEFNAMLGFSTSDVREMIAYYQRAGRMPADTTADDILEEMRPWYDNYCFSTDSLDCERVFNSDMVLYYLSQYMRRGKAPEQMIDPNTRTDYAKLKVLLRLDGLDGERKSVIRQIAQTDEIVGAIADSFPASRLTDPDIFVSLLYYYGMLTIKGRRGISVRLGIPNNNVRKQYYEYLLEMYREHVPIDVSALGVDFDAMALDGLWHDALQRIADMYRLSSSVRSAIEGERNIQGFFTAMLALNAYYLLAPELELDHGYCDFFLMPDRSRYQPPHSYIIEVKYLAKTATEAQAEAQWREAVEQINRYAAAPRVGVLSHGTRLHKIVMQFVGWDLKRMEEV